MIIVVTGTDTGVGKTVATAAVVARATGSVVMVKPVQTGIGGSTAPRSPPAEESDAAVVHRLTGRAAQELTSLEDPLAPDSAARLRGVPIPLVAEHAERIRVLAESHELVVVEGAGGVLVRLDTAGGTVLDLAAELGADIYVVTRPALGTLNHTELTVAAIRAHGLEPRGLVIGSWPARPGLAERCNRADLPRVTGVPLVAVLPEGAGRLDPDTFRDSAATWFFDE